eukprot:TRINITY_DN9679_c0_g1_i1.p1 TRINITY_DN9679_c0_g1~~TRINITY_DN9679_c0_g1_i1.p1  ORF type:complete len:895 (+),score=198.83 TRINITY_DN9679_c0_g1_i1:67-2685(+)
MWAPILLYAGAAARPPPEPFPPLTGRDSGTAVPLSPDPLVAHQWSDAEAAAAPMQIYYAAPVSVIAEPPSCMPGAGALPGANGSARFVAAGAVRLDFGVERAAWLEFDSPDLGDQAAAVSASISEYTEPWDGKTLPVTQYGNTYRLETNKELYEGVRYAWIFYQPKEGSEVKPWTIARVRAVSQVYATNYTGSFHSADQELVRLWYTGAYGSRLNMHASYFGSILMDRGDRVSIQGDGHPTMAAALAAFGSKQTHALVASMLNQTDSGCPGCHVVDDGLMSYPILWTMSVNDYYWASGDNATLLRFAPDMATIIDKAVAQFGTDPPIQFMGWDDRLANGFCGTCNNEAQLAFAGLVIRACTDFAASLRHAGQTSRADHYSETVRNLTQVLRQRPCPGDSSAPWYACYGVHAAANAVNAAVTTPAEEQILLSAVLNDSVTTCSFSPFNQYWILQGLGNMGRMDYAEANARWCWGGMLTLAKGCFWELYSPEWTRWMTEGDKAPTRPSYCHPWGSGVTPWLTRWSAGIVPLSPGYAAFAAIPYLSPRSSEVAATVAAPGGAVSVAARRSSTEGGAAVTVTVAAPASSATVGLRLTDAWGCVLQQASVRADGAEAAVSASAPGGLLGERVAALHVFTAPLGFGTHSVTAEYSCPKTSVAAAPVAAAGFTPPAPYPPASYPATLSAADGETQGDWLGKYGSAGHVLYAYRNGTDLVKLPDWITSVGIFHGEGSTAKGYFVGSAAANRSYLQDPDSQGGRSLGYLTNGADGEQGTVIDVNTSAPAYCVTIYYVSGVTPQGRSTATATRMALRAMDLATLNPVAPGELFGRSVGGAYRSVRYGGGGLRLRFMPVDGDAGLCALFFDLQCPPGASLPIP